LGVAVYKTLGIGLGFTFDHTSKLKQGEVPSVRRLQARAAKSAVKRAQQLHNASDVKAELDSISDPEERDRRAKELRQKADEEIKHLAQRLSDLVPTDLSLDDRRRTKIEQFTYEPKDFTKTSANHEFILQKSPDVIRNSAVHKLVEYYDSIDEDTGDDSNSTAADDEYIKEWERAQYSRGSNRTQGDDSDGLIGVELA